VLFCFQILTGSMKNNCAFTLVEMLVVITIIGALTAIAIPSYNTHIERVRSAEGVQSLTALLGSQKRYQLDNGAYAAGPALTAIDIDIAASNSFDAPTIANGGAGWIARITRDSATIPYTLSISATGVVTCSCLVACTPANICTRIGY
jgi:prepilin-type N-terminal cleavage/methylation domain-containing protein